MRFIGAAVFIAIVENFVENSFESTAAVRSFAGFSLKKGDKRNYSFYSKRLVFSQKPVYNTKRVIPNNRSDNSDERSAQGRAK